MHVYICRSGSIHATRTHTHVRTPTRTHTQVSYFMSHTQMSHFHIWMRHVTYEYRISRTRTSLPRVGWQMIHVTHMNASCHTWMSHVTDRQPHRPAWVMHTYDWGMSRLCSSHVPHIDESCNPWERDMSHIHMRHVTCINVVTPRLRTGSCHTSEQVMSHIWRSHVTHMEEAGHTYKQVMSHTYEWVMSHNWMSHVTHLNAQARQRTTRTGTHSQKSARY